MTVLCISSQVVYGPVGNSAAVPALEAAGLTVLSLPTTVLSNHPGHGDTSGIELPAEALAKMLKTLQAHSWLDRCTAVMTGYFRNVEQIAIVSDTILQLKQRTPELIYFCDPILGDDHTGVYVSVTTAEAIRDQLAPLADIIAPNRFELEWLTGRSVTDLADAKRAADILARPTVIATSIPVDNDTIATAVINGNKIGTVTTAVRRDVPHGTGDLLSGLFLAAILRGNDPFAALGSSMAALEQMLDQSGESDLLNLPGGLAGSEALTPLTVDIGND